ncbi:uncharacterized protein ELE39_001553 [Cryptosporidium sp. chipmunk genotype I]|uniref:uncharacterized protein n=1 Tax=Cryptosporidium sp. chipmunk genotype I TaxID=1280935 RepID=UPI00351A018B|nr:hypothetical protein ELE39_001553 [Cryptosporidium sp. chipmunk genotype I]
MANNTFDEALIRDTIKLLHDKLSLLFHLNNLKSTEILLEIDESISKCSEYCISSCAEIIIPPIIMSIHNCMMNKPPAQLQSINEINDLDPNNCLNTKFSLQLEELLKILLNVLQKINSKTSKIIFSRISIAFFDILHAITKVLNVYIHERNGFIIEYCIKISYLNFNIFWEYWELKDINTNINQHLIIPVIIQFLLSIAIPNRNEFEHSKDIRILALKLLSEIPGIVKNNIILIKVYPGVFQRLSMQVINSITEVGSKKLIEVSLFAIIEWISNCIPNINPETKNCLSSMENIKNTAKILNYIIKYKTFELNLDCSHKHGNINYFNDNAYMLKVKSFFATIASMCLTNLFDVFHDNFDEILVTSLDFLVSLKCEDNDNNSLVDYVLNSISKNQSNKISTFFSNYSQKFLINFEQINTEKLISVEIDKENNLIDFIRILTKYIGLHKTENSFFQRIIHTFRTEDVLNFFLKILISNLNLIMYEKSIKDLKKTNFEYKYENQSLNKENFILKIIDITERPKNYLFKNYSDNILNKNNDNVKNDNLEALQLYGDIFTLIFFNNKKLGFEKSKLISSLIIKSISISILNLNHEKVECKYIFDCIVQNFVKLNINRYDYNPLLYFILNISLCNASQLILNQLILGSPQYIELLNFEERKLPDIIISWFNFVIEELSMDFTQQNLSNCTEINRNISLILLGNLLLIARKVELDREIFIKKFNKVIMQLISLYGYGSPITKKIATYILEQMTHMLGYSSHKFSINTIIDEYSLEIIRSLEMMYYKGYSKEKVDLILTALQHCKLKFILELSDLIERFNDININNNPWIFEFIAIITKRLSTYILRYCGNLFVYKIFKNAEISVFRQKLDSFRTLNTTIREICYGYFVDYITSQENNMKFYSSKNFINDVQNHNVDYSDFSEHNLLEEIDIANEISNIRKVIERIINIIYSYTSEIDGRNFSIQDYQHLSTYSLLNCIFILSTEPTSLFPYVNIITPGIINQWMSIVSNIRSNGFGYFKAEVIKLRELFQTNIIAIQLIISCTEFAVKILEEKLIPLITEFIEFIFANCQVVFMDDRESELNSEFQKLCISALEVLYYFTKFYLKLGTAEIKFETLNSIVNLLISPINSFFSVKWRIIVSKTILHIYFKFPSVINSKLMIQRENYNTLCLKETEIMIKLIENNLIATLNNKSIISETRGEFNLKLKINKL